MDFTDFVRNPGATSIAQIELSAAQLDQLHAVLLQIATDIKAHCEDEGLEVSLAAGSVLGAVRHRGIIPWDDDIDLNMTRETWRRFYPGFLERFGDTYDVLSLETAPGRWVSHNIKIARKGTVFRELLTPPAKSCGVFVDIFIIENVPDSRALRLVQGLGSQALRLISSSVRLRSERRYYLELFAANPTAVKWFRGRFAIGWFFSFLKAARWAALATWWHGLCHNTSSRYVSSPGNAGHYFGELMPRGILYPLGEADFAGLRWSVPADADSYLTRRYGQWRQPPPASERAHHALGEFDLSGVHPGEGEGDAGC